MPAASDGPSPSGLVPAAARSGGGGAALAAGLSSSSLTAAAACNFSAATPPAWAAAFAQLSAALLAQSPPQQFYSFTHPDVARISAMAMFLLDAFVNGQPTDFESVARLMNIQPRALPPRPASANQFATTPPTA